MINLDRYVAWVPLPSTGDGVLELTLAMSPATSLQGGVPDALTYDDWIAGDRPEGFDGVRIEVNCKILDPDAPAFRKLPTAD